MSHEISFRFRGAKHCSNVVRLFSFSLGQRSA